MTTHADLQTTLGGETSGTDFEPMVAKGAELLDTHRPGWAEAIDLESLNMADYGRCILGQLFGDYWDGAQELGRLTSTDYLSQRGHGFTLYIGFGDGDKPADWYTLHELWRREVVARVGP
jgi:hypothetical protein